ncbi:MAG: lamin tail domain-containing protein, partial [Armatimonadetes bacterium]|nr:lamin tail domain-containing protein [Armatimonadota bacterium]
MKRWLLIASAVLLTAFVINTGRGYAQTVLISEFVASNDGCLYDEDGDSSDWIELYNPESVPVNLEGWGLTDSKNKPQKWVFPAVTIQAGAYMIVFASDKDRRDPAKPLHTNYKLDAQGEYVGLYRPDLSLSCEYGPTYPPQQTDVSYGMGYDGTTIPVVPSPTAAKAVVPPNNNWGLTWTQISFNDSSWKSGQTGLGFERSTGYESLIGLNVLSEMYNVSGTAYLRIPFSFDGSPTEQLTLRMKYDDGFVAYLNGVKVASRNAPSSLGYRSVATRTHEDSLAVQWEYIDITAYKSALVAGQNVLAVHGLNASATSSDFLVLPEIVRFVGTGIQPYVIRFFSVPTPGGPNGTGSADQGPAISDIAHTPSQPSPGEDLTVTARVMLTTAPVNAVTLTWRMNYGATSAITMLDDGLHGDGEADDGVFGAVIP